MKKLLSLSMVSTTLPVLVSLLLFSTIFSNAQQIIPKLGGNLTSIAVADENSDVKTKFGLVGGVAFDIPLTSVLSIQTELLFHQKGYKGKGTVTVDDGHGPVVYSTFEQVITLNYLELPILAKFNFKRFYLNVGPYLAYGIGGRYKITGSSGYGKIKFEKPTRISQDGTLYYDNAFDYGAAIGGGVKIYKGLIIDLRYNYGFANLVDKDLSKGFTDNKSQSRSLQLTVGYTIKLK